MLNSYEKIKWFSVGYEFDLSWYVDCIKLSYPGMGYGGVSGWDEKSRSKRIWIWPLLVCVSYEINLFLYVLGWS